MTPKEKDMKKQTTVEFLTRFPEVLGKSNTTSSQEPILIKADMTPKEKADELVLRYLRIDNNTKEWFNLHIAKQCALITVDELIKVTDSYREEQYFLQVIEEIEKL